MEPQTRRLALPNRIRYPADCPFASSCSPPHLTMTQLLSATALWHTPTGTFTLGCRNQPILALFQLPGLWIL